MFEFLIDTLKGEPLLCDLENVGACYPDDDVIYMFGVPCRLSSARPTQAAPDVAHVCPVCGLPTEKPMHIMCEPSTATQVS